MNFTTCNLITLLLYFDSFNIGTEIPKFESFLLALLPCLIVIDSVTGADDGVTGADDSVTGADDGVTGADDGVTGADGLAVDVVDVHVVGVLHSFLADLLQKGVAGNDFVRSLYFFSQHLHFFHTCSSFSLPRKCLYVLFSSRLRVPALVEIFRYCQECFRCCNC